MGNTAYLSRKLILYLNGIVFFYVSASFLLVYTFSVGTYLLTLGIFFTLLGSFMVLKGEGVYKYINSLSGLEEQPEDEKSEMRATWERYLLISQITFWTLAALGVILIVGKWIYQHPVQELRILFSPDVYAIVYLISHLPLNILFYLVNRKNKKAWGDTK